MKTVRSRILHVLAMQGPFEDESGFASRLWFDAVGQSFSFNTFVSHVHTCKMQGEIETLTNGKRTYLIEITDKGREHALRYAEPVFVSEPELKMEPEIISEPEPEPVVSAKHNLSDLFELAAQEARKLQDVIAGYADLERQVAELSQALAKVKASNQRKDDYIQSLETELETLKKQPRKTLRADQLPRWCRDVGKLALQQGWTIITTPSGHYKWTSPEGISFNESATPSDHRTHANLKARLQRMGMTTL